MRRLIITALLTFGIAAGCSGSSTTPLPANDQTCCPASSQPECCMEMGGKRDVPCGLDCDIPDPSTPGWTMTSDRGCPRWVPPAGPLGCGAPPPPPPPPVKDASTIDAVPYGCQPADVSTYVPPAFNPPSTPTSACSSTEVDGFWSECFGASSSPSKCATFETAHASCAACLVTPKAASTWGPFVDEGSEIPANIGGCIALAQGDASAGSCAAKTDASYSCVSLACLSCALDPEVDELAYEQCIQDAAAAGCRKYVDAACDATDGGFASCIPPEPFTQTWLVTFVNRFCNP